MATVRALFCFSFQHERVLFLDKRFPTVERRACAVAKRVEEIKEQGRGSQDEIVLPHLPVDYEFSSLPYGNQFLLDSSVFPVPQSTSPIGQIPPSNIIGKESPSSVLEKLQNYNIHIPIWPVIHIIRKDIVYVAIPFLDEEVFQNGCVPHISDSICVTATLSLLENISRTVLLLRAKSGTEFLWEELDATISSIMPFGTVIDCHPERTFELLKVGFPVRLPSSLPKRPTWRPFAHKGKQSITILIQQSIESQSKAEGENSKEQSNVNITGSIIIEALLSGDPELTFLLQNKNNMNIENECVSPYVSQYEMNSKEKIMKLRAPLEPFILYSYSISQFDAKPLIPITGSYFFKQISSTQVKILLQLKFLARVNSCTVSLPFPNRGSINAVDVTPTCGKSTISSTKDVLHWKFGSKTLASKSIIEAALPGFISFDSPHGFDEEQNDHNEDRFCVGENSFAEIFFEMEDVDFVGWDIDLNVSPPIKQLQRPPARKTMTARSFKIWNTLGNTTLLE